MTWPEAILGAVGFISVAAIFIALFYFASKSGPSDDPLDRPWPKREDPMPLWRTTYKPSMHNEKDDKETE